MSCSVVTKGKVFMSWLYMQIKMKKSQEFMQIKEATWTAAILPIDLRNKPGTLFQIYLWLQKLCTTIIILFFFQSVCFCLTVRQAQMHPWGEFIWLGSSAFSLPLLWSTSSPEIAVDIHTPGTRHRPRKNNVAAYFTFQLLSWDSET